jgi:hypothetical protein
MKIKLYLCCATFILLSCSRKMNPDNYEKCQIIFGSGGGFTNLVNEYHLLENKRLYHKKSTDTSFTKLGRQNGDTVKLLFDKTNVLMADTNALHNPGNMYYFIKLKDKNKTQELIWGGAKENADESILQKAKDLYKELMNLVNLK